MEKKTSSVPTVVEVTHIDFDDYARYQIEEISDPEWLEKVAGAALIRDFFCNANFGCRKPQNYTMDGDEGGMGEEEF